jgi:hypothetical protein
MSNRPNFMKRDKVLPFPNQNVGQAFQPAKQVDLSGEPGLYCPRCLSEGFTDVFGYRLMSRLISPNGQEQLVKAQIGVVCIHCGFGCEPKQLKLLRQDEHGRELEALKAAGQAAEETRDEGRETREDGRRT